MDKLCREHGSAITLSTTDHRRIQDLIAAEPSSMHPAVALLERKLRLANLVQPEEIPGDVVTLGAQVKVLEPDTQAEYGFTLVIPGERRNPGCVSVLAPVGAATLGLAVGQEVFWHGSTGRRVALRILNIVRQTEATGH